MGNLLTTRRRNGTVRMLNEITYKLAQRVMTLDITHLMQLDHEHVALRGAEPAEFTFRFITSDEVRRFAETDHDITPELADRIELGRNFCFAALSQDRLAAYAWYAIGSIEAEHNRGETLRSGVAMSFPANMAFMYKGFTHLNFRGKGLYGFVNAMALEELQACGVTTVISTADWTNSSALRSCWRLGYQDLGLIWRCGWGRLTFTFSPRRGRSLGIRFGRRVCHQSRERDQ